MVFLLAKELAEGASKAGEVLLGSRHAQGVGLMSFWTMLALTDAALSQAQLSAPMPGYDSGTMRCIVLKILPMKVYLFCQYR